jgi:hypothetical protein
MQFETWLRGPVPKYRVNKQKDRRYIRQQTADPRGGWAGNFNMQIENWFMGPVPTYRVNKHKDRRDIR